MTSQMAYYHEQRQIHHEQLMELAENIASLKSPYLLGTDELDGLQTDIHNLIHEAKILIGAIKDPE